MKPDSWCWIEKQQNKERPPKMKTKPSRQLRKTKPTIQLKDIKPKKNPSAGALNAYISKVVGEKQGG